MYSELVEGENGKGQPRDTSVTVGIKKLLIDVGDMFLMLISSCRS